MDFKLVIVVLFMYYVRPQDWVGGMSGLNLMKPLMGLTLIAMFTRRRGFSAGMLVRTPLDWAMVAYAAYIVFTAPDGQRPLSTIIIFVAYFFVTSQALVTPRRLSIYLRCWLACILIVAAMAVMSVYGIDLTGAQELTNAVPEKPRLVLNTYLFKNANSLGHTVVIAIPLAYLLLFWKRPIFSKLLAVLAVLLAAYCVYLTKSKGAYLVGGCLVVASVIVGRHWIFQTIAIFLAATIGWAGLSQLPRMTQIASARQDEAIMGRMLAWEQARFVSKESNTGEGFKNFKPLIYFDNEEISKATHSSYVLVGAELGRFGMFFFLAVLFSSCRILLLSRPKRLEDERSRKAMFILLLAYLLSGWLIDRSYHMEYFLLAGAVAAYHRRLGIEAGILDPDTERVMDEKYESEQSPEREDDEIELTEAAPPEPVAVADDGRSPARSPHFSGPALAYSATSSSPLLREEGGFRSMSEVDTSAVAEQAIEEELAQRAYWRRFGIIDILLVVLCCKIVFEIWDYLLRIYFEH